MKMDSLEKSCQEHNERHDAVAYSTGSRYAMRDSVRPSPSPNGYRRTSHQQLGRLRSPRKFSRDEFPSNHPTAWGATGNFSPRQQRHTRKQSPSTSPSNRINGFKRQSGNGYKGRYNPVRKGSYKTENCMTGTHAPPLPSRPASRGTYSSSSASRDKTSGVSRSVHRKREFPPISTDSELISGMQRRQRRSPATVYRRSSMSRSRSRKSRS